MIHAKLLIPAFNELWIFEVHIYIRNFISGRRDLLSDNISEIAVLLQ